MIAPHTTDETLALDDKATSPKEPEPKSEHPLMQFVCMADINEKVYSSQKCDTMNRGVDEKVTTWAMFHPQVMTRVKLSVCGEKLGKVLWQGRQWAVTDYGLECRDGTYHVRAKQLMRHYGGTPRAAFNGWYQHIAGKSWVDAQDLDYALQAFVLLYTSKGHRSGRKAGGMNLTDAEIEEYANLCASRAYESAIERARLGHVEWSEFDDDYEEDE